MFKFGNPKTGLFYNNSQQTLSSAHWTDYACCERAKALDFLQFITTALMNPAAGSDKQQG
ncbi:MAG: hypothetical protein FJ333_03930 [Sphingomonadales bacterium]|nr:hypothetical protein [Sphingomonadales bacterium]